MHFKERQGAFPSRRAQYQSQGREPPHDGGEFGIALERKRLAKAFATQAGLAGQLAPATGTGHVAQRSRDQGGIAVAQGSVEAGGHVSFAAQVIRGISVACGDLAHGVHACSAWAGRRASSICDRRHDLSPQPQANARPRLTHTRTRESARIDLGLPEFSIELQGSHGLHTPPLCLPPQEI